MSNGQTTTYALVLGGSRGLGLATVEKLLAEGIPVIAVHRDRRKLWPEVEQAFSKFNEGPTPFYALHQDAVNKEGKQAVREELQRLLGETGKISILVHSIARGNLKPMNPDEGQAGLTQADFAITAEAMAFNLFSWVRTLHVHRMFFQDARVIAFTSEGSHRMIPGYGAVAAAKAALEAIIRQIAVEFAPSGIRANCIQAGVVETDSLKLIPKSGEILGESLKRNPSGRLTTPRDVAEAVYLLTRPEAAWITGNIIRVDGGESLK
jgi:enoyl-[acyl-carrier protein] reductase I